MEKINLNTPDQAKPGATEYVISEFVINTEDSFIVIELKSLDGLYRKTVRYNNAGSLINTINTANMATISLERRILQYLVAQEPSLAGTISTV